MRGVAVRVFELSTHVQSISRGDGRSATAAAAYRACCEIACEREGRTHDYSRKQGLEAAEIVLPKGAPAWASNRSKLWNAAELVERNGKRGRNAGAFKADAQTAREFFFSFPVELSAAGRLKAAQAIARHLADVHAIAADFAIHRPGRDGDERNFHCHILTTTRRLTAAGLGAKAREWADLKSGAKLAKQFRRFIASTLNDGLKEEGKADVARVEHRSFQERGSGQVPTKHQGPMTTGRQRRKHQQERQAWAREQVRAQRDRQAKELTSLTLRQDFAARGRQAELAQRMRAAVAATRQELAEQRRADIAPTGLRRLFLAVTGRAGREAFDRQAREMQRLEAARMQLAGMKAALRADRAAFAAGQARERAALIERHGRDDRQLHQAVASRQGLDRAAEVTARRAQARPEGREWEEGRGIEREMAL